jgi:hypothetical protein
MAKAQRPHRRHRRWPIWLLLSALSLLVVSVLLMHRSYRGQLDASLAHLQQSVALAQAQQARLAAQLRAAQSPAGIANDAPPASALASADATTPIAARLEQVATELQQLARGSDPDGQRQPDRLRTPPDGAYLDWSRVRTEVRALAHALRRQQLAGVSGRRGRSEFVPQALRGWLQRARHQAAREDARALAQSLVAIQRLLAGAAAADPGAARLARRTAALHRALTPGTLTTAQRRRLERLASETAAIARRLQPPPAPESGRPR